MRQKEDIQSYPLYLIMTNSSKFRHVTAASSPQQQATKLVSPQDVARDRAQRGLPPLSAEQQAEEERNRERRIREKYGVVQGIPIVQGQKPEREGTAPPGMEDVVKALKEDPDVDNPWAVAWSIYDDQKRKARLQERRRLAAGAQWLRLHPELAMRAAQSWVGENDAAYRVANGHVRRADLQALAAESGLDALNAAIDGWTTAGSFARQEPVVLIIEQLVSDEDGNDLGKMDDVMEVDNPLALLELGQPKVEDSDVSASALDDDYGCDEKTDEVVAVSPGMDLSLPVHNLVEVNEGVFEAPPEEDTEAGLIIVKIARFLGSPGQLAAVRRLVRSAQAIRYAAQGEEFDGDDDNDEEELFRVEIERLDGEPSDVLPASLSELENGILQRVIGVDEDAEPTVVPCPHAPNEEALEFADEDGQVVAHVRIYEEDDEPLDEEDMDRVVAVLGADRVGPEDESEESDADDEDEHADSDVDVSPLDFGGTNDRDEWF